MGETAREVLRAGSQPCFRASWLQRHEDRGACDASPSVLLQIILNIPFPNKHRKAEAKSYKNAKRDVADGSF